MEVLVITTGCVFLFVLISISSFRKVTNFKQLHKLFHKNHTHIDKRLFTRKSDELYYRQQGIERFIDAQKTDYKLALAEIERGRKQSHWIWYIFPQLVGLGRSCYSTLYGIRGREEAEEYLQNEVLGRRLREITNALLKHNDKSAEEIFGGLDAMKVRSCMTLFDAISPDDIFAQVLDTFYDGKRCEFTLSAIADKTV